MLQRVQLGDPGQVGDHRAGRRASARADRDAVVPGVLADVGDHEEVGVEAHRGDDAHLQLDPLQHLLARVVAVAVLEAGGDLLAQERGLGLALGHVELRHPVDVGEHLVVRLDPLRDGQRVVAGLRQLAEEFAHLLGGLDVVAGALELEPVRVVLVLAHADAEQAVVGVRLVGGDVVRVVGGQQRDVQLLGQAQQVLADLLLDGQAVVHQLQEVVLLAEDVLVGAGRLDGLLVLPEPQPGLHLAGGAAGGGDDAGGVGGDQLAVHPGLHVVALHRRERGEPEEVPQAGGVLRPHGHVGVAAAAGDVLSALAVRAGRALAAGGPEHLLLVEARGRGDVRLDADDRLDAGLGGGVEELVGAEHVAVVTHRDGGHALSLRLGEELAVLRGPVQHRVLRVDVQVREAVGHGAGLLGRDGGTAGVASGPG